jgi:Plasmid pRiA4b ORF-3-like protein
MVGGSPLLLQNGRTRINQANRAYGLQFLEQFTTIADVSITRDGEAPPVSRIVAVPLGIHLDMLHLIIRAAMGWSSTHLWLLQARDCTWGVLDPDFGCAGGPSDAGRATLLDMIADIGTNRFEYVYDFGDRWSHLARSLIQPAVRS